MFFIGNIRQIPSKCMRKKKKDRNYPVTEEQLYIIQKFLKDLQDLANECVISLEELNKAMLEFYNEGITDESVVVDQDDNYNFD